MPAAPATNEADADQTGQHKENHLNKTKNTKAAQCLGTESVLNKCAPTGSSSSSEQHHPTELSARMKTFYTHAMQQVSHLKCG